MATSKPFKWEKSNNACIATYNILEGDTMLNQFDVFFLSFEAAPKVLLSKLPYYPKFGASPEDIEGRASQMARQYFKFLIRFYTNRKENSADSVEKMLHKFENLFEDKTATIADLAKAADGFLKFAGE